jgi:hypothetical protein
MAEKLQMVIANRLRDGLTVFLAPGERWSEAISEGAVAQDATGAAALLAIAERHAAQNVVVGPYLIEVGGTDRRPLAWREAIRAFGPTVETGAGA